MPMFARAAPSTIARAMLAHAKCALIAAPLREAENLLLKARNLDPGSSEAERMLESIRLSRATKRFLLIPEKGGKRITILVSDVVTVGRMEADILIADERVGRGHLRIRIHEDSAEAESRGLVNEVRLRGAPISKVRLEDGDILDLAGAARFEVRLCEGPDQGGKVPVSVRLSTGMDEFLLLRARIRCERADAGLAFRPDGACAFSLESGAVVFRKPGGAQVLHPGATLDYKGLRFAAV